MEVHWIERWGCVWEVIDGPWGHGLGEGGEAQQLHDLVDECTAACEHDNQRNVFAILWFPQLRLRCKAPGNEGRQG